jgi:hypothetical protein
MKFTKFTVFDSLPKLARNDISQKSFFPSYKGKIIIGECEMKYDDNESKYPLHVVRVWRNDNYFTIDSDRIDRRKIIGALDYSVNKRFKVEFLYVQDNDDDGLNADPKYVNATEYTKAMISIAERKALESQNDRIIMDTHQSLRLFHRYYEKEGFVLTNKVASDHPAWVETEKILPGSQL